MRGGDIGSLPAVLGLIALVTFFSSERPTLFPAAFNFGNLITQGAPVMILSMGLIFVLLLGEIDLSAGFTAGTAAAVMAVVMTNHGWPWPLGMAVCVLTGTVIGLSIGTIVTRLGIPSFVVTLAAVPGPAGTSARASSVRAARSPFNSKPIYNIDNANMPIWLGWALFVVARRAASPGSTTTASSSGARSA